MLGFLSLNLGIFNLLPIPVLDGGAIFLLLIEGLLATIGLKLSMTVREQNSAGWFCDGDPVDGLCDHQRRHEVVFALTARDPSNPAVSEPPK